MSTALAATAADSIRPADAQDIELLRALAERIWPVCFAGILTIAQIANIVERIYSPANLEQEMHEGHRFWIAYSDNAPVGYVSAYKQDEAIWLKKIYLDERHQGKGLGRRMFATATEAFMPAQEIRLLVNCDNAPAQKFYDTIGFARIKAVPVMMGDHPFTDYLYIKTLHTEKLICIT